MYYIGMWKDLVVAITDSLKDLEFYLREIRGLKRSDYSIQEIGYDTLEFYANDLAKQAVWMIEYEGIMIPQIILEIISYDISQWVPQSEVLLNLLVNFSKLMINTGTIKNKEDIDTLMNSIKIVSKITNNSEKIFDNIEESSFLSHPVLHCSYDEYVDYLRVYDTMKDFNYHYRERMNLDYT